MNEKSNDHINKVLSKNDQKKIADVRRDVWTGGLKGLFSGIIAGATIKYVGEFTTKRFFPKNEELRKLFLSDKKYSIVLILGCGSLFSFLGSITAGKNSIVGIEDVFLRVQNHKINNPDNNFSSYQKQVQENKMNQQSQVEESYRRRKQILEERNNVKIENQINKNQIFKEEFDPK